MQPTSPTGMQGDGDNDADDQLQKTYNPLAVMQPGERVVCAIKRHPFGLLGVYLAAAVLLVLLFAGVVLIPHVITSLTNQDKTYIFLIALIFAVGILLYLYVAVTIYKGNRWIVTSDSITQVSQVGLFRKQSAQLSLENLEDVTFEQNGLLPSLIGFGTLRAETAGHQEKFVFPFCPTPQKCAKDIIQAREEFMEKHTMGMYSNPQPMPQNYGQPQPQSPMQPPPPQQ